MMYMPIMNPSRRGGSHREGKPFLPCWTALARVCLLVICLDPLKVICLRGKRWPAVCSVMASCPSLCRGAGEAAVRSLSCKVGQCWALECSACPSSGLPDLGSHNQYLWASLRLSWCAECWMKTCLKARNAHVCLYVHIFKRRICSWSLPFKGKRQQPRSLAETQLFRLWQDGITRFGWVQLKSAAFTHPRSAGFAAGWESGCSG